MIRNLLLKLKSFHKKSIKEEFLTLKQEIDLLISQVDTKKKSYLQNYLYFAHYPIFSFTEGIVILCENGKPRVAEVLLRSLFELHINIVYHQVDNSKKTLALSVKSSFDDKIKNVREVKELVKRHPNLKSTNPENLFSDEWLNKAEQWAINEQQAVLRGNNLKSTDRDPDLKAKALKCDQLFANTDPDKVVDKGHFERMYSIIYRQLSPTSHLNITGVQMFVDQADSGEYLFDDGKAGDFITKQAIEICVAYTKDLYENEVIDAEITDTIYRIEKLLKD